MTSKMHRLTSIGFLAFVISLHDGLNARNGKRSGGDGPDVNATTLRLVHILHRHGDRSQVRAYKNDIYNESSWPQGFGQLSKVGMRQAHDLGVFLRERYVDTGFLNPEYKRSQVYVRSTDVDRTLMTAYCLLSGLFPPDKNQTWNQDIPWQPIPVHTEPLSTDQLLHVGPICPKYNTQVNASHAQNPRFKEIMETYKEEYGYISNHSGEPNTWEGIMNVLNPIYCQYTSNFTLPDWVNNQTLATILKLRDLYAEVDRLDQTRHAYLSFGPLLGEIIGHMVNISSGEGTLSAKFFEYSAHDTNVAGLLITMGLFNDRQPPYRSCIMIELHELSDEQFVVKVLYRNESDHDPYPLKLKYCDILCPLDKFRNIMKSSIPQDLDVECGNIVKQSFVEKFTKSGPAAVIAVTLMIMLLLTVVIGGLLCCRYRNKLREAHDYAPVPMEMT